MKTETLSGGEADAVATVVRALRNGEVAALPSETVYGLAADAFRASAVAKIFAAKERPTFDPLIVHLGRADWLEKVARIPETDESLFRALTTAFWPGPLTFILPRQPAVPYLVTAGLETVAVREPAHPLFRETLLAFGGPLAAPSANRFGRISPTEASHVESELGGRIPFILDGGPTGHGLESTIIRLREGAIEILRPGPIAVERLAEFAPVRAAVSTLDARIAPGRLPSHYAPATPLILAAAPRPSAARAALLAWSTPADPEAWAAIERLSPTQSMPEAAARLFACLRRLDAAGLDQIVAEEIPEHGLGIAMMDRLRRAAAC